MRGRRLHGMCAPLYFIKFLSRTVPYLRIHWPENVTVLVRGSRLCLDALAKLRKATISFVLSVCPFVRVEKLGSDWMDFH